MSLLDTRLIAAEAERRSAIRWPVDVEARFSTISSERRGHLVNLSQTGARMDFGNDKAPPEGISGMLSFEGHEVFCKVVWSRPDACGLEFESAVSPILIARHAVKEHGGPVAQAVNIPLGRKREGLVVRRP